MSDLRNDDADIDALMGSVVGNNGQVVEFPSAPERAAKKRAKAAKAAEPSLVNEFFGKPGANVAAAVEMAMDSSDREKVAELSTELETELQTNDVPRVIDPRTVPVRFSNLKHMARSALHYFDAVQLGREDTLAMRIGRGAHAMILGLPVVKWTGKTRQGKAWEAFKARHEKEAEILNAKEWAAAEGMANAIRRHPIASRILFEQTILEEQFEWEWLGRKCTSRPDARRGSSMVADLKTTQCAEPTKFKRDAYYRGYNAQLAFYALAVEHLTGKRVDELYVVAVESKRPYAVQVLQLDDNARLQGEKLCRLWMERLLACEASDHWPAYTDAIATFDVPSDGDPDAAIDIEDLPDELFA